MPGSVKTATAVDYFPQSLYTALSTTYHRHAVQSEYPDGSSQRYSDVATSTRSWRFKKRLTASQLNTLRQFYQTHIGKPFYYRDPASGQYIKAVFSSPWSETYDLGRYTVELTITEVY